MSELQVVFDALNAINGDILQMAQGLHGKAQEYGRASAAAANAARSAEGEAAAALARTAAALAQASRCCGLAAQSLNGASREGQAFVQREVGGGGAGGGSSTGASAKLVGVGGMIARLGALAGGEALSDHPAIAESARTGLSNALGALGRWDAEDKQKVARWFGEATEQNRAALHSMLTRMEAELPNITLKPFEPGKGGPSTYAYVYPEDSGRNIFVGETFWRSGSNPPDAQAGVIFHELSHFRDIGGTHDHQYGSKAARSLAGRAPSLSLDNADNIEYFMEEFL